MSNRMGLQNGEDGMRRVWHLVEGLPMHARAWLQAAPPGAPAVVLVHGQVVSSRYMVPLAHYLARDFQVYAPDLPGFGRSEGPPHALGVGELADALAAWMHAEGLAKAHLVGNSFGCQLIAEMGLRHPRRIARVVLQGPTIDPHARTIPRQLARFALNAAREPPSLLPFILLQDYIAAGAERSFATFRIVMQDRIEEKLPHLEAPTLVVRGSRDPIVPARWAEEATRLLPRGRLVTVPGAAHTMNYNWPLELARVTRPFLRGAGDSPEEAAAREIPHV